MGRGRTSLDEAGSDSPEGNGIHRGLGDRPLFCDAGRFSAAWEMGHLRAGREPGRRGLGHRELSAAGNHGDEGSLRPAGEDCPEGAVLHDREAAGAGGCLRHCGRAFACECLRDGDSAAVPPGGDRLPAADRPEEGEDRRF